MNVKRLKQYIYDNDKIGYILEQINCHSIKKYSNYYTCGNYDGDNKKAIIVYCDTPYLKCINYTRDIRYNNSQNDDQTSLIDLVCYNKKINLFQAIKFLCDILGLDYYSMENEEDIPESLKITEMLYNMSKGEYVEEDIRLKPISEKILTYYKSYVNDMFYKDGISYEIQKEFEIGYDDSTNYITIPIRDELGNLVGVKGRIFDDNKNIENKYIYLEKCARSKILYGLNKSIDFIKKEGKVLVGESEKMVMQLFSMGYYNCVATGGKKISKYQKNKLASLGVDIVFCFDKDVQINEIKNIVLDLQGINIYTIYDDENILGEKESPSDNKEKWKYLINNKVIKL